MSKHRETMREYLRARSVARTLHARVSITPDGRLLGIRGEPNFATLFLNLVERPLPLRTTSDLGFSAATVAEFSTEQLHLGGAGLNHWEAYLRHDGRRELKRRVRQHEWQEVDVLRARLAQLHTWRRQPRRRDGGDLLHLALTAGQEEELTALLEATDRSPPERAKSLARVVYWFRGAAATKHYLSTLATVCASEPFVPVEVVGFMESIDVWQQRAATEDGSELLEELELVFKSLPSSLRTEADFRDKRRKTTFKRLCEWLLRRCGRWLARYRHQAAAELCTTLSTLAACQSDRRRLPLRVARDYWRTGDERTLRSMISYLGMLLGQPGYGKVLALTETLPELPDARLLPLVRKLTSSGATRSDIAWAIRHSLLSRFSPSLWTPQWVRRTHLELESRGISMPPGEWMDKIDGKQEAALLADFMAWLRALPKTWLTPRLAAQLDKAFKVWWLPALRRSDCHSLLRAWAEVPQAASDTGNGSMAAARWLDRIACYQQMCGARPSTPKSLRRQLDLRRRYEREVEHLRGLVLSRPTTAAQQARLRNLEDRLQGGRLIAPRRLQRTGVEAYVATALESLRFLLRREASRRCQQLAGLPELPDAWLFDFANWVDEMSNGERFMVRAIAAAWQQHGRWYRAHLPSNQSWLRKAREAGLDIEQWLVPEPTDICVQGERCRLAVSHDPRQSFLMGSYVSTCLSLPDGCNVDSVRPNTYDANKQVLYLRNAAGNVLGRQLVAISKDFGLLGYDPYSIFGAREDDDEDQSETDESAHQAITKAFASYCGRWAKLMGVTLADDGEPEMLTEEWYDDGVAPWPKVAATAYAEQVTSSPVSTYESVLVASWLP